MDKRKNRCQKKKNVFYVDESLFEKWSPDMAYALGFFAADGTLTYNRKRKNYYVEFASTDLEILRKIKKVFCSKHKISTRKYTKPKWQEAYRIQIGSKKIFQDLVRRGFTSNKSLQMVFPTVSNFCLSHFVRGYFDGDGYCFFSHYKRKDRLSIAKVILSGFVSGSRIFLETLKQKLKERAGLVGGTLYYHSRGYRLVYSLRDSQKLYNFMYKDIDKIIYLKRKFLNFQKIIKDYGVVAQLG